MVKVGHGCDQDRAPGTDCITQLPQGTFPTFTGAGRFLVVPRQSQSRFYILGELGAEAPMRASRVQAVSVTSVVVSLELVGAPGEVVEITVVDALGLGSNLAPGTKWVVMKKQTIVVARGHCQTQLRRDLAEGTSLTSALPSLHYLTSSATAPARPRAPPATTPSAAPPSRSAHRRQGQCTPGR